MTNKRRRLVQTHKAKEGLPIRDEQGSTNRVVLHQVCVYATDKGAPGLRVLHQVCVECPCLIRLKVIGSSCVLTHNLSAKRSKDYPILREHQVFVPVLHRTSESTRISPPHYLCFVHSTDGPSSEHVCFTSGCKGEHSYLNM